MDTYADLIEPLKQIAKQAGDEIMRIYESGFSVQTKTDKTPVTEADLAADQIIAKALAQLSPDIPVLSEEGDIPAYSERKKWSRYWLVDPLDGTREFVNRTGEFTVNIALIKDQQAVLGMIYVPVTKTWYFAACDGPAYRVDEKGLQQITTSEWAGGNIRIACSRSSRRSASSNIFANQFESYELMPLGSSLKSCYVAEGRADIYIRLGPTSEWDTGAAQVILEQAGGALLGLDMLPLRYNTKESLLNPHFMSVGDLNHDWLNYLPERT